MCLCVCAMKQSVEGGTMQTSKPGFRTGPQLQEGHSHALAQRDEGAHSVKPLGSGPFCEKRGEMGGRKTFWACTGCASGRQRGKPGK